MSAEIKGLYYVSGNEYITQLKKIAFFNFVRSLNCSLMISQKSGKKIVCGINDEGFYFREETAEKQQGLEAEV